jgi:hypothetical protein
VVAQGHISAVGRSDAIRIPAGSRVVDATGKFLIPGLWDTDTLPMPPKTPSCTGLKDRAVGLLKRVEENPAKK